MDRMDTATRTISVKGADLDYREVGSGRPVVFLHGILGDLRTFSDHADLLADRFRAITYTQRYFGTREWPAGGPAFGIETHAQDLIGFVEALGSGPVFVVAWSYAGHVALRAAQLRPELFRAMFVYESGYQTFMTDAGEVAACRADLARMMGPVFEAVQTGDISNAARLMVNGLARDDYYFDSRTEAQIAVELDNAHTLQRLLGQAPPPRITAEDLEDLQTQVTIACGAGTRPAYRLISEAAMRHVPGQHFMIPGVGHYWPDAEPRAFSEFIGDWLNDQ